MTGSPERKRVVEWDDPLVAARAAREMTGQEFIEAVMEGTLPVPPIARLLGFGLVEAGDGRAVFEYAPHESHYNPIGSVQGGVPAAVFDAAMGCAIQTKLPRGAAYTTLELHVNLVRGITKDTPKLRCEGEALHVGRSTGIARATLKDASGKLYGHATTTCLILTK